MSTMSKVAFWSLILGSAFVLAVFPAPQAKEKPQPFRERTPEREIERHTREETIAYLKRVYGKADFETALERIAALESVMQRCRWCNAAQSYGWRAY